MEANPYEAPNDGPASKQSDGRLEALNWFFLISALMVAAIGALLWLGSFLSVARE